MKLKKNIKSLSIIGASILLSAFMTAYIIFWIKYGEKRFRSYMYERQLKKVEEYNKILDSIENTLNNGFPKQAEEDIFLIPEYELTDTQKKKRLILIGDIYEELFRRTKGKKGVINYADLAAKYYQKALKYTRDIELKKTILAKIAKLFEVQNEWEKALYTYKNSEFVLTSPQEAWNTKINEAKCLYRLKRFHEAIINLNMVAEQTINVPQIRAHALRLKADYLLKLSENNAHVNLYQKQLKLSNENKKVSSEYLRNQADKIYKSLFNIVKLPNRDLNHAYLGMLKIITIEKKHREMYRLLNRILEQALPTGIKHQALIIAGAFEVALADELRKKKGEKKTKPRNYSKEIINETAFNSPEKHLKEAVNIYIKCLNDYTPPKQYTQLYSKLYDLYLKLEDWDNALITAYKILYTSNDKNLILKVLSDFSPQKHRFFKKIPEKQLRGMYAKKILKILDRLRDKQILWDDIKRYVYVMYVELFYLIKNYDMAVKYIDKARDLKVLSKNQQEELAYIDFLCAKKQKQYAPMICRSSFYLSYFPNGEHYQEVLVGLMNAYFSIGMYDECLSVAKQIYMDEISKAKSDIRRLLNDGVWLPTVAKIGQCYIRKGEYGKANAVLKSYIKRIKHTSYAGHVFKDWAILALKMNQTMEAIRRLSVIIPTLKSLKERFSLAILLAKWKLKIGIRLGYKEALALIKFTDSVPGLSNSEKAQIKLELYETVLEYLYNKAKKNIPYKNDISRNRVSNNNIKLKMITQNYKQRLNSLKKIFLKALPILNSDSFLQFWALKILTPFFNTPEFNTVVGEFYDLLKKKIKAPYTPSSKVIISHFKKIRNTLQTDKDIKLLKKSVEKLKRRP